MKTVQEWLNEVDEESLADTYFVEFPIDFVMLRDQNHTVAEIRRATREQFINYVRKMRIIAIPPRKENDKTAVFYASKDHRNHERGINMEMCYMEEVLTSDEPEHYACSLTDHAEVMGYLVADTPLTIENIESVLSQILFETSFFGYDQECLPDVIESLKRSEEDIQAGEPTQQRKCGRIWGCRPRSRTRKRTSWRAKSLRRSMPATCSADGARKRSCGSCFAEKCRHETQHAQSVTICRFYFVDNYNILYIIVP